MSSADKTAMLIATLLLARDITHREHLKTRSYAQHMALGDFYGTIVDLADSLAESWQGRYAKLLDIPLAAHDAEMAIVDNLAAQLEWIHEQRYEAIPREESALQNIIDEIEALYMSTLYKLRFLA